MTCKARSANEFAQDQGECEKRVDAIQFSVKNKLKSILLRYVYFHIAFIGLILVQSASFIALSLRYGNSVIPAFLLSSVFLTFFSFLILRLYFRTRKIELRDLLSRTYVERVKELIGYREGSTSHRSSVAAAAQSLSIRLQDWEYELLHPWRFIIGSSSLLRKLSCFCFWRDVIGFRENLLIVAVDMHLKIVQQEPVSLKTHASLASAFVLLSGLFADPRKYPEFEGEDWIPDSRYSKTAMDKFRIHAERAIEEFKILKDYFPGNPWVHTQLAYSYHDLQMPLEEIHQYEILSELRPDDEDVMFQLGVLYFRQGLNAFGLKVYERLKNINYVKSKKLISFYGSFFY